MRQVLGNYRREPGIEWWRMKVLPVSVADPRELGGELTDRYDLYGAYEKAHEKRDPLLAPHGFFRALKPGDFRHAGEFLEMYGPLTLEVGKRLYGSGAGVRVDLGKFWGLHLRFCLVSELWESLRDRGRLASALLRVFRHRKEVSKQAEYPLGTLFSPPPSNKRSRYKFPWQHKREKPETWLKRASVDEMRQCALSLVHFELNAHMRHRQIIWQRGWERSGEEFRLVVWVDSLWSAIWEFFGLDTAGVSWRRCPHCQRYFYPKRKDQFYCTPRQQALWSKRRYAAQKRARAKRQLQKR